MPRLASLLAGLGIVLAATASLAEAPGPLITPIDRVWSAHPVRFGLASDSHMIVVAYYDANRQVTLASRPAGDRAGWKYQRLPSWTGWDSHNYLSIAIDRRGFVHLIGNLHNDPLLYFRSERPWDIATMASVPELVDRAAERRMTYPEFLRLPDGRLAFKYRDGGSGNGNEIYLAYDEASGRWSRLLDTPLVDGEGARNAYFVGPVRSPDERFHLVWVWRETPDAATNHDLSYAVSSDLVHWERSDGTALALPIRLGSAEVVDPVPVGGGIINNNTIPGFDAVGRVVLAYHKYDAAGDTQVYVARREAGGWRIARASEWEGFRWDIGGGGSLDFRLSIESVSARGDGQLEIHVVRDGASRRLILDGESLRRVADVEAGPDHLAGHLEIPPGMQLNRVQAGSTLIAWPTLKPNRDLPRAEVPPPTVLHLVEPDR